MNKILLVPGLHNSGPDHWQSRWHQHFPHWQRMVGLPWDKPDLTVWSAKLASKLRSRRSQVHLVAHSFGALTAIAAARLQPEKVASILIVAPADPARFGIPDEALAGSVKVSAQLIASRNDPWMTFERAEYWSRQWQVPLFDAGEVGHINAQSGHGEWGQGLNLLGTLYRRAEMVVEPVPTEWGKRAALSFR
ncbi:acetoin dehydrogenase E2 subunit dihydrolipoyllysine-residue acetyltransferase [Aeromonas encheleia]|uniref:RBBP9/YdeN family alpha/beta hydrolase n=1 Tax=Aeromonas TaxID=642 RepID=UPI0005B1EDD5|nr:MULTISPECIES: alpha/beta hydrolase [Aeromonas]MBV7439071.1 alpha/beta hydrolase [Aeromonas sp. sif2416]VEG95180.1 acetoin dehydrogenase E2 subunit dihydrolipoyllysine-residue acetyltransferase [Aeromonas encheleia]